MPHARAQLVGGRDNQCDATAIHATRKACAYALLDGIGDEYDIRLWTARTARLLAMEAARCADAEAGLRTIHAQIADEYAALGWRAAYEPSAVAVVAVVIPGELVQVAWCGDARAYILNDGEVSRLTSDHNDRQRLLDMGMVPDRYARNTVNSYLGYTGVLPKFGAALGPVAGRLLLASDGAYEPLEDSCRDLAGYLKGDLREAAQGFVTAAIDHGSARPDNATVLVADFG